MKVLALVERATGRTRMMRVDKVSFSARLSILHANIAAEANLLTDDASYYRQMHSRFAICGATAHTKGNYVAARSPR